MIVKIIGSYSVPIIITIAALCIMIKKDNLFDEFTKGCRDGLNTSIKIFPNLLILICAVKMFSASGALDLICNSLGTLLNTTGLPKELIPLIVTRPISGSAATAITDSIFAEHGPDSYIGRCASVLMGSSDTIIYTLSMYFGASGITKTRYAIPASFTVFIFCTGVSVMITKLFW